jgi:hypothetical protein
MLLFGEALASFVPLYEVFRISHGCGPAETKSIRLADQISRCCVAATLAAVNLNQELETF